mgnify:CR=1 FL=1
MMGWCFPAGLRHVRTHLPGYFRLEEGGEITIPKGTGSQPVTKFALKARTKAEASDWQLVITDASQAVVDLGDHIQIVLTLQDPPQALAEDRVVIDKHDCDWVHWFLFLRLLRRNVGVRRSRSRRE